MPWNKPYVPVKNQRLDPELYKQTNQVCFITIRAYRNQTPFVRDELNQLVIEILSSEQARQNCGVLTYCLMPDHLHFLISPLQDGRSVLVFADQFKGKSTNGSWAAGWKGKLWQPRYFDHIVRNEESLLAIDNYILNNPTRRGLVDQAEDWRWSGHMNPLPLYDANRRA